MKEILDQMEEHITAIRNLQRNFDFHSKRLEKLMKSLKDWYLDKNKDDSAEAIQLHGNS
jgi:predicted transcriptional regulator